MKNCNKSGAACAAFGAGLLTAIILPSKFVLVFVAISLIIVGCSSAKKC